MPFINRIQLHDTKLSAPGAQVEFFKSIGTSLRNYNKGKYDCMISSYLNVQESLVKKELEKEHSIVGYLIRSFQFEYLEELNEEKFNF